VPKMRLVDAVQDQVGERDGIDEVLFLPAVEGPLAQRLQLLVATPNTSQ